jgi:Icc-related predicted phosphoesterase
MKLLGITDLHGRQAALERILADAGEVDLVLFGGDITNFGSPVDAAMLIAIAEEAAGRALAVAGNCDSAEIDLRLLEMGVGLRRRGVIVDGVGIHGLSAMPPWQPSMYHFTEAELAEMLEAGFAQITGAAHHVVLSHPPPRRCRLDRTVFGRHVGSAALREFIDRVQPRLVLCGHIHEGRGIDALGETIVVNCGPATAGSYAVAEIGEQVRVELRSA